MPCSPAGRYVPRTPQVPARKHNKERRAPLVSLQPILTTSYCTVSCVFPEMLPEVAVMVVVPVEIAVTKPEVDTEATAVLLDVHATEAETLPVVPSEYVAVAMNCCDDPLVMVVLAGLIAMLEIVLLLTVRLVVAKTLPDLA